MKIEEFLADDKLQSTFEEWQVCKRCAIRLSCRNFDYSVLCESARKDDWICYVCCGLLQESTQSQLVAQAEKAVRDSGFEFDAVRLTVSAAGNVAVRERVVELALADQIGESEPTDAAKAVWKWLLKTVLPQRLGAVYICGASDHLEQDRDYAAGVEVHLRLGHRHSDVECAGLLALLPSQGGGRKQHRRRAGKGRQRLQPDAEAPGQSHKAVSAALAQLDFKELARHFPLPPLHRRETDLVTLVAVEVSRLEPLYIGGRYLKTSRRLPQSPWILDGERRLAGSVEESLCPGWAAALRCVSSPPWRFLASGREDVDVRMLGNGRPFVVELPNHRALPHSFSAALFSGLVSHPDVRVTELARVSRSQVALVKCGEEERPKTYRCLVWTQAPLSRDTVDGLSTRISELTVMQDTPIRVLHRRSLHTRPRTIHSLRANFLEDEMATSGRDLTMDDYRQFVLPDPGEGSSSTASPVLPEKIDEEDAGSRQVWRERPGQLLVVHLRCQAGTYVKEFVHGDLGRTRPSMSTLVGCACDMMALDVLDIELAFPPAAAVGH